MVYPAWCQRTVDGVTTDRRILLFVLFHLSVWPSFAVPIQRTEDGLTTDRRIPFFLTESVWPSSVECYLPSKEGLTDRGILLILAGSKMTQCEAAQSYLHL